MYTLLHNCKVIPVEGSVLESGVVLLQGGKIAFVGERLDAPEGAVVVDCRGGVVTPGLVDAHTHIGSCPEGMHYSMTDENEMTNPVTSGVRILESVYPFDDAFRQSRAGGVTAAQTLPGSGNVIGGTGCVLKTWGKIADQMAVVPDSCMKAALGENPRGVYGDRKTTPSTRMGNAYVMRKALLEAKNYMADKLHKLSKEDHDPVDLDLDKEALLPVLQRRMRFSVHAHRADDIATAVRIAGEFDLKLTVEHCTEGHMIADWLAARGVKVATGPSMSTATKPELANQSWRNMAELEKAGVHYCLITDHPVLPLYSLILNASYASHEGLTDAQALRAVTLSAAEHIDLAHRLGSLKEGKDADLVVWTGEPLDSRSQARYTFIDGKCRHSLDGDLLCDK